MDGPRILWQAVKSLRVPLACALTVAFVLIIFFHAPAIPVLLGGGGSLVLLLSRAIVRERRSAHRTLWRE